VKILLVQTHHYFRGGDCTYGFSLAELLKSNEHQVHFFSMHHPNNLPSEDSRFFVDYIDFREVNKNKNLFTGFNVVTRSIYSSHVRKKFKLMLDEIEPDIIHVQNLHGHITPSILFEAKKQKIPVVMTLHDYKFICPNTHLLSHGSICEKCINGKYYNCTLNKCKKNSLAASLIATIEAYLHRTLNVTEMIDTYVSPSSFLRNKFIEFGWKGEKIRVINNFLPQKKIEDNSSKNENYVLYFGQLEEWKGIRNLLVVARELPDVFFYIVGDGSLKSDLIEWCKSNNLANIKFFGYKSGKDLEEIVKFAKIIVMPSVLYENYPYSVMEAMAFGKPIIASNIGGIPELIHNNINGLIYQFDNTSELAKNIKYLYDNDEEIQRMGKESYKLALKNFNEDFHYNQIMALYREKLTMEGS